MGFIKNFFKKFSIFDDNFKKNKVINGTISGTVNGVESSTINGTVNGFGTKEFYNATNDTNSYQINHNTFQTMINTPSPRQNLTFEQLSIYYQAKNLNLNGDFKNTLELLTSDGKDNYLSYMLADENGISIKVAKYAGTTKVNLIENEEYGYCCIIKATKKVLEKFEVENKTFAKITSKERIEKNLVDKTALREAIINAIVHNDYSLGTVPLFEIFSDRIQITSYGGLVKGLSQEEFFDCYSIPRNKELMRIFKDLDLVEHLGSGMSRILNIYDKSIFKFTSNFLVVSFPIANSYNAIVNGTVNGIENFTVKKHQEIISNGTESVTKDGTNNYTEGGISNGTKKISPNSVTIDSKTGIKILNYLRKNPDATSEKISQKMNLSKRTIMREIKRLKETGKIKRTGSSKFGYWEVIE